MMVLQNQDIWFPNTLYLGRASQNQKIHGQKNVFFTGKGKHPPKIGW
jgi:hypothetical protein